nr:hypothetical protein [Wolbachia endosymbiont of Ctenocephalides felis wCfeT]
MYINDEKSEISYNFSGFPFSLTFHVTNPKISNEQFTLSSKDLLIKNRLFDKSVYAYVPSNEVNITFHGEKEQNIKCHTSNSNNFMIKLKDLLFSLQFDPDSTLIDYVNTLRYEDYGLKCEDLESRKSAETEVNDGSNYIQISFNKEINGNAKSSQDLYIYRYKDVAKPEDYLSMDIKLDYEFVSDISASSMNFNIEKLLVQSNKFSIIADGGVRNYNFVTSSFEDQVNVSVSNYKELVSYVMSEEEPKVADAFEKLLPSLSEKTTDDSVKFSIRYDNNIGTGFIGKLSTADFISQLSIIDKLIKNESSN